MRATAFAANSCVISLAKKLRKVLLFSALFMMASVSSWGQLTLSTSSLTFASTLIDTTSAGKTVTITNTGVSAQPIVITMSGDYAETDTCGGTISASGSCVVTITFSPTVLGSIKGAASIFDNSNNLLAFVGISGSGGAPVTTAPASLAFTGGTIGTISAAKTFKITNNTTGSVTINSITTSIADYTINTGTCLTTPLASKGKFCTVSVQVTPTSATDDGAIIITDNAANALPLVVKLTSAATAGTPPISLSKSSLIFKTLSGTTSAAQTVTVTNTSGAAATLGTITASADYAVPSTTCGSTLATAGTCTFQVTFAPTFVGSITGAVAIPVNSPNNQSPQLVNLTGTSEAVLTVAPASLAFGSVPVGTTTAPKAVKITNNSASAVTLSTITISGDFGIQLSGTTCVNGFSLLAGKNCTIEGTFSPTVAQAIVGAITVNNSGSPNPLIIALGGTGTNTAAATLNPTSAHQGSSETIVIAGTNTNFGPTTTVNFGANITTGTLTVNGPTSMSVPITIDNAATVGSRTVTITTGAQVAKPTFTVIAGVPAVTLINPNTIQPTQTESVGVTGAFTTWGSTTKANFGPGIAVGGAAAGTFGPVTVNGPTSITASLVTSGATAGFRTVQIQTGSQTLTVNNGMDVETCTSTPPTILSISPANGLSGVPLNTKIQIQFSVPMNRSTLSQLGNTAPATIYFWDSSTNTEVPATISVDASGTIATITPTASLGAGRTFYFYLSYGAYVQDACGNNLNPAEYYFYTAYSNDTTGPTLTGTSPVNNDTNIALNGNAAGGTPVVLQFSEPIDPITAQTGFSMTTGGNAVPGNFSYSVNDQTVTFTPVSPLTASTTYTVTYTAQITDTTGTALTNPSSFSFKTGTAADTGYPQITGVDPAVNAVSVGLNVTPHFTFSEPVNELTIPGNLNLYYEYFNLIVPATVTVAADRLSATITPSAPLLPSTLYYTYICGYTNIAGNGGQCYEGYFYTGNSGDTNPTTVSSISPTNGQLGVPINTQVVAVMSDDIDPTTVTSSAITVKQGSTTVAGTVTLAANGTTLTFVPSAPLAVSTAYSVTVAGFKDVEGNAVTAFSSTFNTGTTGYGSGTFTLVSTSPTNGAPNVSVTSPVTFTMSNLIDAASVTPTTVYVYAPNNETVAGSYSVSGNAVTFTPLSPYPASTTMTMYIYGLSDEAGNLAYIGCGTFTTANTTDHTAPTVTISPSNGATNVGINSQVVLTFSKSINTSTINANSLALFNGNTSIGYGYSISADNRTLVLNPGGSAWTSGATITIELTTGIQDLSGNSLANTNSQFTLTTALSSTAPYVVAMRPGNGATNVPANTLVTLFTSMAMNPASIAGALHVTDNGVVVSGSVQLYSNAQAIEFTPAAAFGASDLIQVRLDSTAVSASNVPLSAFAGQFTVAGTNLSVAATVQAVNPYPGNTNVPLNAILQVAYNQPLLASTVNSTNVVLYQYSTSSFVSTTLSLVDGGQVINVVPSVNLVAGSNYFLYISYGGNVTNTSGVPVQAYELNFTAGSAADSAGPIIVSQAPTNNSTNIGINALVSVNFNKAINPISVTGTTIALSAGSNGNAPSSISFSPDYTRVSITPQAPMPPSTVMTVAISGVTSEAGKAVATTTTHFTTAAQPNCAGPYVVSSSVINGQTNVPVNSAFSMTFNEPIDIGTYSAANVNLYSYYLGANVPVTVSWSADLTTISLVPTSPLAVGTQFVLESYSLTDLSGNTQQGFSAYFTTDFATNTNPPTVINTSPENALTQVPVNAPVQILFSEPIQPSSINKITLTTGGNPVAFTPIFSDANQLLTLKPTNLLAANANFTLTITGVQDTAGNVMTGTVTNTFSTGPTFNLTHPQVTVADPPNGATNVGTNVAPHVTFSERLNPLSVVSSSNELYNNGSVELYTYTTGQYIPATVSMSLDRMTATITPTTALQPNTTYYLFVGETEYYYDVAGNNGYGYQSTFTTGSTSDTTHATVSTISPVNGQLGVPLNPHVVAVMSDEIDPTTVNNSSITLTPSGGSAIAGTVSLASDGVTLTYTTSVVLNPSTVYNVAVGGFSDVQGNTVTPFPSSFTTGTTGYSNGSFTLVSTSPANTATGVSVTSPVTFNMNNLINPASVNPNTVYVYVNSTGEIVAGSYSVSGASVTFTPLSPYPASTLMGMYIYGLTDEAGNVTYNGAGSFTTTNTADTTAPTVTITPSNGTTNVGINAQVVLTFSKSINPSTINGSSVNILNGDKPINPAISVSKDNRTVVLNYNGGSLPAGATLTVTATSLITDLSGNALANTTSEFTTTPPVSTATPYVINMRPGSGATGVPTTAVITLFTSAPMNSSTVTGALDVSQSGVLVSGTTTVGSNGQSILFTPSSALPAGTRIQVNLSPAAQDIYGNSLSSFSGSFTTSSGSLASTTATVQAVNPFPGNTNVPLNAILQVAYNQPLLASTVNSTNVVLYQYSTSSFVSTTLSLVNGGQVINVVPSVNLVAGSNYFLYVSYGGNVTNTSGVPVQAYELNFTAGTSTDTTPPTITAVAPSNLSTKIGTNAGVSVTFNKAINPISVTGSSIKLSGGSVTEVPSSISFSTDYTRVMIVPQAPLPASTLMTIAINGVTSVAGVAVTSQSTTFTTMAGPDFNAPYVVNPSVQGGQTVGTNAAFAMQFNKPMDPGSVNTAGNQWVFLYDYSLGYVATTISFSADLTTVFLTPTAALTASHQFEMCSYYMMDLSGNSQNSFCVYGFFTGSGTQTTGPVVTEVSPASGLTGVPINAPVQILFNGPISGASLGGVTLKQGGSVVPTTTSLFDGDQAIQLLPLVPLASSTVYTINVTGVVDISGNAQSSFASQSFTTGTGTDLVQPTYISTTPANGATNVAVTTTVQVVFSEAMSPASFDANTSFTLRNSSNVVVPATITFSTDYKTATLQPKANLSSGTLYYMYFGYNGPLYDLGGNQFGGTYTTFTTH